MVADIDIFRSARILIDRHGAEAAGIARKRMEDCSASGDAAGRAIWQRIDKAIAVLSAEKAGSGDPLH